MRTWFIVAGLLAASCDARSRSASAATESVAKNDSKKGDAMIGESSRPVDPERLRRVPLVLRVIALGPGQGDKYAWVRVKVLTVFKNTSGRDPGGELEIAYYSGKPGLPAEECTVYLEPYNETPNHPWRLLGGSAVLGVSHPGQ